MANIKLIVMALVELSTKETDELSKVLEEEYGIKPAFKVKKPSPERMFEIYLQTYLSLLFLQWIRHYLLAYLLILLAYPFIKTTNNKVYTT
jgi:hypothetical protein